MRPLAWPNDLQWRGLPGRACCYWRGSADAARSRASDPAADRARPAAILGLRCCTARAASQDIGHGAEGFAGDRVRCQLPRVAQARPHAEDDAEDDLCRDKGGQGVLRSLAEVCVRPGGQPAPPGGGVRRACGAGPCAAGCSLPSRPGSALRCRGPTPPARSRALATRPGPAAGGLAAQCPAPTAAWVTTGAAADTHARVPEGLVPSRAKRTSSSCNRALLLSRAILALSPRRRGCARLPGCRHRDAAARRGQGAPVLRSGAGGGREARASKGQAERRASSPRRRPPSWKKSWPGRASSPSPDPTARPFSNYHN